MQPADGGRSRIPALDVLRGFALCGIAFVNIEGVGHFPGALPSLDNPGGWLQLLVQQRFFPIFSLLFGMGFSLFLASAAQRTAHPRVILLRRLALLLPLGFLHQQLHPGEALLFYAVFGLLVLLPSSWLPRWVVALGAAVLLPTTVLLAGGGWALIPALFLLGSALVRYGVVDRLGTSTRGPAVLLTCFAAAAVPALVWQGGDLADSNFSTSSAVAGLALAGTYVTAVLILLRTPLRQTLQMVFVPLGRMALTNYVAATPVMVLAGSALDWTHDGSWTQVLLVAAAILVVQWVLSTLWLRRFRQGPLERLWRWATWAGARPLQPRH
ncbi:DUF418 domain-containing protein [Kineosporiaceae bacterium B12]|nr:DUF418 domain-containing protein [Kineococcus rubinsiae]